MQKIRCPRCGVVNLEGFVTYPQCAGCGMTLPAAHSKAASFWQRPLSSWLWVTLIGSALAGALGLLTVFEPPGENNSDATLLYGNAARRGMVGDTVILTFTADAVVHSRMRRNAPLRDARLRVPLALFQSLRLVAISPAPDLMTVTGSNRYFHYRALPLETNLVLRLRAVRVINQKFRAALYAADCLPSGWRFSVEIVPRPTRAAPIKREGSR